MARTRDKVQQMGFWDPQVSEHRHDEVCDWAVDNADILFAAAMPSLFDRTWCDTDLFHVAAPPIDDATIRRSEAFQAETPRPNPTVRKIHWERPLTVSTGYRGQYERIVGFADLLFETTVPSIQVDALNSAGAARCVKVRWDNEPPRAPQVLVEAKSSMSMSFGELMRQLQVYRAAHRTGPILVVSPDDRYATKLRSQEIHFYHCKL